MAINVIELVKNKNYGFQLTAPDMVVDLVTLNLITGDCTSTYFDSPELAQFKRTALELFTIVAPPERAAGALNLLNRILAVAAADDATVTRSALVVGDLATLRATVDANPGSLVAHVPFSADGALAWAGGNDGGGGGGAVNAVSGTFPVTSTGGAAPDIALTYNTARGLESVAVTGLQSKVDATSINFTGGGALTLTNTGVAPGAYGDSVNVPALTVDAQGRITNVVSTPIMFPPPPPGAQVVLDNEVFVAQNGNDVTGDGSASKPFASIEAAMASISAATPTNRYAIKLAAGSYTEAVPVLLKPDVFIVGDGWQNTTVTAEAISLDPSFGAEPDAFSGLYGIRVEGPVVIDTESIDNATGRFDANNVYFNGNLTITSKADTNISGIVRCVTGTGVEASFLGGEIFSFNTLYQGPVLVDESRAAYTSFYSAGDFYNADFNAYNGGGTAAGDFLVMMAGSSVGYVAPDPSVRASVTIDGDIELRATSNFVPAATQLSLVNGATLVRWSDAQGVGYVPSTPANWLVPPDAVNTALDELASRVAGFGLVAFQYELYVAKNGNDGTGDGSLSKPYLTIGAALTQAGTIADTNYVRINVAPGVYAENVAILRRRTFVVGATAGEAKATTVQGLVAIAPATGGSRDADIVAISRLNVAPPGGGASPSVQISGVQLCTVYVNECQVNAPEDLQSAIYCDINPPGNRSLIVVNDSKLVRSSVAADAPMGDFVRGEVIMDQVEVTVAVGGTASTLFFANDATLRANLIRVDALNTQPGLIYGAGAIAGGVKLTITNSSIISRAPAGPAACLYLNSTGGLRSLLWNVILGMESSGPGIYAIDGVPAAVANLYSQVTFAPSTGGTTNSSVNPGILGALIRMETLGVLPAKNGGTGQSSYTVGDLLYASGATALSKLADVATGNALISGGVGVAPAWGKIDLTTTVSGILPAANGGTGLDGSAASAGQLLIGNGTGYSLAALTAGTGIDIANGAGSITVTALGAMSESFVTGEAITTGDVCYLNADGKVWKGQSNAAATSKVVGIAAQTVGAADLPIVLVTYNKASGLAGLTTATEYYLSATVPGAVVDYTTLSATSGAQIVSLGYARSATEIQVNIQQRGTTP